MRCRCTTELLVVPRDITLPCTLDNVQVRCRVCHHARRPDEHRFGVRQGFSDEVRRQALARARYQCECYFESHDWHAHPERLTMPAAPPKAVMTPAPPP